MSEKPSYLGLLNAIAVGESRGYELLSQWGERADNPALTEVLNLVAIREHEHAAAFTKRLSELGYQVRQKSNPRFTEHLALAKSEAGDRGRRLRAVHEQLESPPPDDAVLGEIVERLGRLPSTSEELNALRQ
jgi:hypothetical protein